MKYIEIAVLVLGATIGAAIESTIKIGDGNAAVVSTFLITGLGFLILFLFKRKRKSLPLEEQKRQNELKRQQIPAINDIRYDIRHHAENGLTNPKSANIPYHGRITSIG